MKCFWTFFKEDNGVDVFDTFICKPELFMPVES